MVELGYEVTDRQNRTALHWGERLVEVAPVSKSPIKEESAVGLCP